MTNLDVIRRFDSKQMAKYLNERVYCAKHLFESDDPNKRNCATCWHPQDASSCIVCVQKWLEEASE